MSNSPGNGPLNIIVVGGGTAGWMTAAAIAGVVPQNIARVRLIESDAIGTVGVGEATLPQMKDFNDYIGVIEPDMMQQASATFKLGIEFVNWGFKGSSYIHPFGVHGHAFGGAAFHHHWVRAMLNGEDSNLEDYCFPIVASRANRFEFPNEDRTNVNSAYSYAYHLDASQYAKYLRRFSERRGVVRTEGKVVDVTLDGESGDISSVKLDSGDIIAGDLFIDCSGFRALLIGEALGMGYEEWTKWLPCDRAVAVPCESSGALLPYTRATAREAGWQWRIPLQHRTGNGYVYSSQFVDDENAAETLLGNLDGAAMADPLFLKFTTGRRHQSWYRNCIAVGLSSGFLEPLESTSIYLIQMAIINLIKLFPRLPIDPSVREEYNRMVDLEYDRVRDFLILHYHANDRDDAELWRHCRDMEVPDSLTHKLAMFRARGYIENYKYGLFAPPSWLSVLIGQGVMPEGYDRLADNVPFTDVVGRLRQLRAEIAEKVAKMPDHAEFIEDYCPAPGAAAASGKAMA